MAVCAWRRGWPWGRREWAVAAWVAGVAAAAPGAGAAVVYVDDDAGLGGDGQSWATAYRYLQDGLAAARADGSITEIRVGQGVYRPDQDEGGLVVVGDRDAVFELVDGVALRGGYRGLADPAMADEREAAPGGGVGELVSGSLSRLSGRLDAGDPTASSKMLVAADVEQPLTLDGFELLDFHQGLADGVAPVVEIHGLSAVELTNVEVWWTSEPDVGYTPEVSSDLFLVDAPGAVMEWSRVGDGIGTRGGAMLRTTASSVSIEGCESWFSGDGVVMEEPTEWAYSPIVELLDTSLHNCVRGLSLHSPGVFGEVDIAGCTIESVAPQTPAYPMVVRETAALSIELGAGSIVHTDHSSIVQKTFAYGQLRNEGVACDITTGDGEFLAFGTIDQELNLGAFGGSMFVEASQIRIDGVDFLDTYSWVGLPVQRYETHAPPGSDSLLMIETCAFGAVGCRETPAAYEQIGFDRSIWHGCTFAQTSAGDGVFFDGLRRDPADAASGLFSIERCEFSGLNPGTSVIRVGPEGQGYTPWYIEDSVFDSTSSGGANGAVINADAGETTAPLWIRRCEFVRTISGGVLGGEFGEISNCTFLANEAVDPNAVVQACFESLSSCTFVGNERYAPDADALVDSAIQSYGCDGSLASIVEDCIFYRRFESLPAYPMIDMERGAVINCLIQGGEEEIGNKATLRGGPGVQVVGVFDADPMFVNYPAPSSVLWDLRLLPGSPAIDRGLGGGNPGEVDLDGLPRVARTVGPACRVDLGAFEYQGEPCLCRADVTTTDTNDGDALYGEPDGSVNGSDLAFFVEHWLLRDRPWTTDVTTTDTNPGDTSYGKKDGVTNGADLSFYVEAWLEGCVTPG